MSSLEKQQKKHHNGTHGPSKCSDSISVTSSVESFIDDTDREVSNFTDRAFRSLCIGEDAIYNDLEVSSPSDQKTICAQEALQNNNLQTNYQESFSYGIQNKESQRATFQNSQVDVTKQHVLREERSTSRVLSLTNTFCSGENFCDINAPDTLQHKFQDFNNKSWDKSALLSIQTDLSEISSGYYAKSGPLQTYGNHFHAVEQMNNSITKFKAINTTNFFFHSEFSPFQLWKDYNRFHFEKGGPPVFLSPTRFPMWYDSPLYKELTAAHRISSSPAKLSRQYTERKIEDIAVSPRSRSAVIQKASALEKRCESEIASNCPPWKNNICVRNKLPSNRPSTVSPTNQKVNRPDSSLLHYSRHTAEIQHKVGGSESNRTTPFNIAQLLTPVIPGRQSTETSEILQFARTPLVSESESNAKQLRDNYKSKASGLLFSIKDNRKRVKSTYSPIKFKGLEISDHTKQPSKLEGRESRNSEASVSQVTNQLNNREHEHYWFSTNGLVNNNDGSLVGRIKDCTKTFGPTRLETENTFSQVPEHLSAEMSEKQTFYSREDTGRQKFAGKPSSSSISSYRTEENPSPQRAELESMMSKKEVRSTEINYGLPYKGEIAALIEMDKQRKAMAKQYLPSASDSYTMRKETCINNSNEVMNGSWFPRDKHIQGTKNSFQTSSMQDDRTKAPSQYVEKSLYNGLQKTESAHKVASLTRKSEMTTHGKGEEYLQRHMEQSDIETERDYSQKRQVLHSVQEKCQYNEGSIDYEPYEYEANKQWHITTTENRYSKDGECMSQQMLQTNMKHPDEQDYVHSLSSTSCIGKQKNAYSARTTQSNLITEDKVKTEEHRPKFSVAQSQRYHKQKDIKLNIPNTQIMEKSSISQTKGDRFNINDILSDRDNEQAKRVRENKVYNNRIVSEPAKVQSQTEQGENSHHKHEMTDVTYGYARKESLIPYDLKVRREKDILINNENDKMTLRALSYKEKGQTKQEILTSKLKAHAQKEISAIKEIAKHTIPSRNQIKQSNEKVQIHPDVSLQKKEITAEKLNHLFQDITHYSIPIYNQPRNQDKDEPKYESFTAEKIELPTKDPSSDIDKVASEKEIHNDNQAHMKDRETRFSEANKLNETINDSVAVNRTILANSFSSSPAFDIFNTEQSVVKKTDTSTTCTSNSTEYSAVNLNGNDIPKHELFTKTSTNHFTLYNISEEDIILERSVNKQHLSNINTDTPTPDRNTASLKCFDIPEMVKTKGDIIKENPLLLPNARQSEIQTGPDKIPSDWTKDKVPVADFTLGFTDTQIAFSNKQMENKDKEKEHLENGPGGIRENRTESTECSSNQEHCKTNRDPPEKKPWLVKQDIQTDTMQTSQTTDDGFLQKLQNAYTSKSSEHANSSKEQKLSSDDTRTNNSKSPTTENLKSEDKQEEKPAILINNIDQQLNSPPAPDKGDELSNPDPGSHVIHIRSKEDSSPTDKPIIYSICVSSKSEPVPEDEPIIFSISVSSVSDATMTPGPKKQENSSKPLLIEQFDKDDKETFGNKNKECDLLGCKQENKEVKMHLNKDMAEQVEVARQYDAPASKNNIDHYRSTEADNIRSSYEKYRLPNEATITMESDLKVQDKIQGDAKKESSLTPLLKMQNDTMDNDHASVEKILRSAHFSKRHSPESRKPTSPEASNEILSKTNENPELHVTQSEEITNEGGTQTADGFVFADRNTKRDAKASHEILMSNVVPVCESIVDTQTARQIMENVNVELKEYKQVQEVQTVQRGHTENDDNGNKGTAIVQVKPQKGTQFTDGICSSNRNNISLNDSQQPIHNIFTNDNQIIKAQYTETSSVQNSHSTGNTIIHALQNRTQQECETDVSEQGNVTKGPLQTRNYNNLENIKKELVCERKFPDVEKVKFIKSNQVKVSKEIVKRNEISTFTKEQSRVKESVHLNQSKCDLPAGTTEQVRFPVPVIPPDAKAEHKNDTENQIKVDTLSTRDAVRPNNVSENVQNITCAKVSGRESALGVKERDLERVKWKKELIHKGKENVKDEIMSLNKHRTASSVVRNDQQTEWESSKAANNDHFDKFMINNTRSNTGQMEIKSGTGSYEENSDNVTLAIESSGKVLSDKDDQHSNVYHLQNDATPQRKDSNHDGNDTLKSNDDAVLTKNEGTSTKTEFTQREKKTARPEISALADYARLKVISAEDDTITEKDLLQKMNIYQKYKLSAIEPQKVNYSLFVGDTEQSKQLSNMKSENLNKTGMPLQVHKQQAYNITDEILEGHHHIVSDEPVCAVKHTKCTKEKTLSSHMQSNTNECQRTSQAYGYSRSHDVNQYQNPQVTSGKTQIENNKDPTIKKTVNAHLLERKAYPQINNSQCVPQVSLETKLNHANRSTDYQINEKVRDEETDELQYYVVNAMESEKKSKNNNESLPMSHKMAPNKKITEANATAPRSNTSSPAMGKTIMFRVKDNTGKLSSVTKTVRPRFHRSFSEEYRTGSPVVSCCGSEKDRGECNHENDLKLSGNSSVIKEQSITSHQLPRAKEILARNKMLSPGFITQKEPRNYNRRSHVTEEGESLISTMSEDVNRLAVSSEAMTYSRCLENEHIRHTYSRPESACYTRPESSCYGRPESSCYARPESACYARPESACYARPESACYERPESACSDMRPTTKPPAVPPKTDKALRRAKRLTSRKINKVDDMTFSDTSVQPETKSIQTVSNLPASPMLHMATNQKIEASPQISDYHVEPNYASPAPSFVAHSFPMTQRKLLQDPNSGQIFMVDVPIQIKTKTFFDPETGKYLQLNVQQKAQSTLSQPATVEMLGPSYVVYPGFLPMPVTVSSLPSVRSSSQMSAPATLIDDQQKQRNSKHKSSQQERY